VKLANIVPVAHLKTLIDESERYHLVIADMIVGNTTYRNHYLDCVERGDSVIIDSLAFERPEGSNPGTLLSAWAALYSVMPSGKNTLEIVLPDRMDDPGESARMTREGLNILRGEIWPLVPLTDRRPAFQVVPHGKTWREYLFYARDLAQLSDVSVVGIQEEIDDLFGIRREEAVRSLQLVIGGKQWHLNGVREDLEDIRSEWMRKNVRSTDTGKFVTWGLNMQAVRPDTKPVPTYPGRKKFGGSIGYFAFCSTNPSALGMARNNMAAWREFLACAASSEQ